MPSKSAAQARLMRAVAHGWRKPGGGGPTKSVAQEFSTADKGRKFRSGGSVKKRSKSKGKINPAMLAAMMAPPPGAAGPPPGMGGPPPGPPPGGPPPMGMKKGGKIGGGIESKGATKVAYVKAKGQGRAAKGKTPTRDFEGAYASGGSVRGGGVASRGRGRGRMV